MVSTPKWNEFPKYPAIVGVGALAIGVTIAWWTKGDITPLFETAEIRRGQLWRLVTSILPHLDILHLAFNLYWLGGIGHHFVLNYRHSVTVNLFCFLTVAYNT